MVALSKGSTEKNAMPVGTNSSDRSKPTRSRLFALTGLTWLTELMTSAVLSPQLTVWLPILKVSFLSSVNGRPTWPKK